MPRYYFNIISPNRVITDPTGRELAGLEAAHWRAVALAYQVCFHLPDDDGSWAIQIEDETRCTREVFVPCFRRRQTANKRIDKSVTTRAYR